MKGTLSILGDIAKTILIALVIVVPIRAFVFQPFLVRGASMEPSFSNGDYLIVDELSYRFTEPKRGEVIVFEFPHDPSQRFIKRIIGLPGETVEMTRGTVAIYQPGEEPDRAFVLQEPYLGSADDESLKIALGPREYFVLGDNRAFSADSRKWGVLPREHIVGRALFRLFPTHAFAMVEAPAYE